MPDIKAGRESRDEEDYFEEMVDGSENEDQGEEEDDHEHEEDDGQDEGEEEEEVVEQRRGPGAGVGGQVKIPIMKDGEATCIRCGSVGVKDTFYGKGKQYCSGNCVKGIATPANSPARAVPLFKISSTASAGLPLTPANQAALRKVTAGLASAATTPSKGFTGKTTSIAGNRNTPPATVKALKEIKGNQVKSGKPLTAQKTMKMIPKAAAPPMSTSKGYTNKQLLNSFDWITLLARETTIKAGPVSSFRHAPISETWDTLVTIGLKLEVKNTDFPLPNNSKMSQEFYWIACVVKIAGYFVLLRYEGFGNDTSKDFWVNIFTTQVHPVGWCASQGKVLIPPKSVQEKYGDWKDFLVKRLTGSRTLPENFYEQLKDCLKSRFQLGMKLEVVDKTRISAVRVATIDKLVGGRLHIIYEGEEEGDSGFWCHQQSPIIHPVGWAQVVGHELRATPHYAKMSLEKSLNQRFDDDDAGWNLFPPVRSSQPQPQPHRVNSEHGFAEGMKLEAIDPLNLSAICVATVTKVLRNNYLMIGIDGMMAADGSDWFCYHATSPCIFPVGFCMLNKLELTPPRGYNRPFDWYQYLRETKAIAAPVPLFKKDIPNHGFKEGMLVEAVDLMEPRLVCVATITKVVGRLLRVHFNGWDDSYDQWCDCESPELFPLGWCHLVGYPLEPPKDEDGSANSSFSSLNSSFTDSNKRKRNTYKGRYKKKRRINSGLNGSGNGNGAFDDKPPSPSPEIFSNCSQLSIAEWVSPTTGPLRKVNTRGSDLSNSSVVVKPSPIQPLIPEKSSKLAADPKEWSVGDVAQFLRVNECGAYCQAFYNKKIDGVKLLRMNNDSVLDLTERKVGPTLKIHALIQSLKETKKY